MLNFTLSRFNTTFERAVNPSYVIAQEGRALVASYVGGLMYVKESAGTSGEIFQGVAVNQLKTVLRIPTVEQFVAPSSGTVLTSFIPITGSVSVYDVTAGAVVSGVVVTGNSVAAGSGTSGHTLNVSYAYVPTTAQAVALYGNVVPGGAAGDYLGQCGVIEKGDVYTTEYDTAADWTLTQVYLGAGGLFTTTSGGTHLTNVTILAAPAVGSGFLGLSIQ